MAPTVTLYAWAVPAYFTDSPVDHTWVTTYDNRQSAYQTDAQVAAAGEDYWYCWGSFHPTGGTPINSDGFLGQQGGNRALAECLVQPNADSSTVPAARGTIFTYGVDGVCHQLANQVLFATGTGGQPQLTVKLARGYFASSFIYGPWGLQHTAWVNKIAACSGAAAPPSVLAAGGAALAGPPDDFEARAREVLGPGDPKKLSDLMALRTDTRRFAAQAWPGAAPSAETLNARNQHLIDQAAALLDPREFEAIFGFPPGSASSATSCARTRSPAPSTWCAAS
ncbi:hypothetical protein, partial [Rhodoplanes roseus]|uniref:hypothetical protein n=1 Tax=Rhodoplanes roseus TaxID=29409 RepID=UPI001AED0CEB